MLKWRIIMGSVLIPALGLLTWLDSRLSPQGAILSLLALFLAYLATDELLNLLEVDRFRSRTIWVFLGVAVPILLAMAPVVRTGATAGESERPLSELSGWGAPLGVVVAAGIAVIRYQGSPSAAREFAVAVMAVTYIGATLATLVRIRLWPTEGPQDSGLWLLLATVATVKMGDVGAYTIGRLVGRHKLAPRLSPGKTIEGGCGAVLFGVAAAGAFFEWLPPQLKSVPTTVEMARLHWITWGATMAVVGILGDLIESLLKRSAGQKDSSHWMPGFGGVLDILDSLLLAGPVAYVWFLLTL